MSVVVRLEAEKEIAVVVIDNPPVNAASLEVRSGLLAAIQEAGADPEVFAVVIIGSGSTFIAGSDLREFGQPLADPQLPAVIAAIESCEKPVVAALHGTALGGGFELALGCDARLALSGTVVGLPEVTLGIIPGAGGTQRMPRLAGIPKAITMICNGELVSAEMALSLNLVDKVVTTDLRNEAIAWTRTMQGRKRRVRDLPVPMCDEARIAKAIESALRAGKNRPAVRAAIEAITSARTRPMDEGLAQERTTFQSLRTSREARALRHQFFAEREAAKHPAINIAAARCLKKIAVIGAGTMGGGIAITALDGGFEVLLFEQDEAALSKGVERIRSHYSSRVKGGHVDPSLAAERQARLKATLDWSIVSEADFVIEAVFEDLNVKQEVFRRLDEVTRAGAVRSHSSVVQRRLEN